MRNLGITLPNESPEEAFSLGCDMIVDAAGLSCSQAVLDMLYALLGYATKGYEKTLLCASSRASWRVVCATRTVAARAAWVRIA